MSSYYEHSNENDGHFVGCSTKPQIDHVTSTGGLQKTIGYHMHSNPGRPFVVDFYS